MEKGEKTFLPNVQAGINTAETRDRGDVQGRRKTRRDGDEMDVKHAGGGDGAAMREGEEKEDG